MSGNTGQLPSSFAAVRGDRISRMAAYDQLPPEVRAAIGRASFQFCPLVLTGLLARFSPTELAADIERADALFVRRFRRDIGLEDACAVHTMTR